MPRSMAAKQINEDPSYRNLPPSPPHVYPRAERFRCSLWSPFPPSDGYANEGLLLRKRFGSRLPTRIKDSGWLHAKQPSFLLYRLVCDNGGHPSTLRPSQVLPPFPRICICCKKGRSRQHTLHDERCKVFGPSV